VITTKIQTAKIKPIIFPSAPKWIPHQKQKRKNNPIHTFFQRRLSDITVATITTPASTDYPPEMLKTIILYSKYMKKQ